MKVHGIFLTALMAIASFASAEELYKTNVIASYYGEELNGNKTASGEIFNMNDYTAAHNTLPFNTLVKVTSLVTSKSVVVRINDRGPSAPGREIDVSKAAASDLGMLKAGTARVSMEIIQWGTNNGPTTDVSGVVETPYEEESKIYHQEEKHYDIQLGAYSDFSNAKILADKLNSQGFKNIAYQSEDGITRVVIRDVAASDLDYIVDALKQHGFDHYLVRQRKLGSITETGVEVASLSIEQ